MAMFKLARNTQQHPHEHCSKGKQKWVSREMISFPSTHTHSLSLEKKNQAILDFCIQDVSWTNTNNKAPHGGIGGELSDLENVGIFFFSEVKTFHESPHPIAGNWRKARRVQKMLGCFLFFGSEEKIHTGNWRKAKRNFFTENWRKAQRERMLGCFLIFCSEEKFVLEIGGKLRERILGCFLQWRKIQSPELKSLSLPLMTSACCCCKEGRKGLLVDDEWSWNEISFFTPESSKLSEGFAGIWNQCCQV